MSKILEFEDEDELSEFEEKILELEVEQSFWKGQNRDVQDFLTKSHKRYFPSTKSNKKSYLSHGDLKNYKIAEDL